MGWDWIKWDGMAWDGLGRMREEGRRRTEARKKKKKNRTQKKGRKKKEEGSRERREPAEQGPALYTPTSRSPAPGGNYDTIMPSYQNANAKIPWY